ncbi:MAG: DUF362 domain-containing protein [Candidatus Thorarchaeota archaeon]
MVAVEVAIAVGRRPRRALLTALSKLSTVLSLPPETDRVVIKPSVLDPSLPGNTTKEMLSAVVKMFDGVFPIHIVESDNPFRSADDALSSSGYRDLESTTVSLQSLSHGPMELVRLLPDPPTELEMPSLLTRPGLFLVNVGTLKFDPELDSMSAGVKNLFGLIPDSSKKKYHPILNELLVALLTRFRPNLTVIDLTVLTLEPRNLGRILPVGGVVVGYDPVAVDSVCASLCGLDPLAIPYLRRASEIGLGEADPDRIRIVGTDHQKDVLASVFEGAQRNHNRYIRSS